MKKMCLLLLMLSMVYVSFSNGNKSIKPNQKSVEAKAKQRTDTMQTVLALSAEQYQQISAINLQYFKDKHAIKQSAKLESTTENTMDTESSQSELNVIYKQNINQVLTKEQQRLWQFYKKSKVQTIKNKTSKTDEMSDDAFILNEQ